MKKMPRMKVKNQPLNLPSKTGSPFSLSRANATPITPEKTQDTITMIANTILIENTSFLFSIIIIAYFLLFVKRFLENYCHIILHTYNNRFCMIFKHFEYCFSVNKSYKIILYFIKRTSVMITNETFIPALKEIMLLTYPILKRGKRSALASAIVIVIFLLSYFLLIL